MPIISGGKIIEGAIGARLNAGAPTAGTSEVQTLTIGGTPTAGTFTITYDGYTTSAITWSATNATLLANINTALDALPNLGDGDVVATAGTLTAGIGTILLTFSANMVRRSVNLMVATSSLTGTNPTAVITETTPGVDATGLGAPKGSLMLDTTNGITYTQTGTDLNPVWTKTGTQT